jgi:hypothetical protein
MRFEKSETSFDAESTEKRQNLELSTTETQRRRGDTKKRREILGISPGVGEDAAGGV